MRHGGGPNDSGDVSLSGHGGFVPLRYTLAVGAVLFGLLFGGLLLCHEITGTPHCITRCDEDD